MRQHIRALQLLIATLVVSWTAVVGAAEVAISPVRIHLSDAKRSELLEVSNSGDRAVRFQITAHTWRQSADEEMNLTPTNDLVFFPSLFSVDAGSSRLIRIASTTKAARSERAYRLIVEEIPQGAAPTGAVRVLTRLNLPVFVQPRDAAAEPTLDARLKRGRLLVVLGNRGSAYFKGADLRIVGRSSTGQTLFEKAIPAWYVLAGGRRTYDVDIPPDICGALETVVAVLRTGDGTLRKVLAAAPSSACPR